MHLQATLGLLLLASSASTPLFAQATTQDSVQDALVSWQELHGDNWRLTQHTDLTTGRFLWGGTREALFTPRDQEEWYELARQAIAENEGIFEIADITLQAEQVKYLDLYAIGTSDKVAVEFHQQVKGIPVRAASVHAIFTTQGDLLGIDTTAMPGVETLSVRPKADGYAAVSAAHQAFLEDTGREALEFGKPQLVIIKTHPGTLAEARLAWSVDLRNEGDLGQPLGKRYFLAADDTSYQVLEQEELIHHQLNGHVESYATPGTKANSGSNPPALHPMRFMTVQSSSGNTTTDASGNFSIPGYTGGNVTFSYSGPWVTVQNNGGSNYALTNSYTPGTSVNPVMNTGQTEFVTSEASCFDSVVDFHEWMEDIDPGDTTFDFPVLANANIASTCNAYYNGSSINMYRAGGSCNNTGFSTVVAHEQGHWANDLYSSGNGFDGFGEGNADVFAMYLYDTPILGDDFYSGGGFIRTGLNTRQFCGDSQGGCYGQVHADGEVLMGALWKVRDNLNQTLGNAGGDLTADTLLFAWMNAFNDTQIKNIIEQHWLILDDNDGNILNGTPNFADIDNGFLAQGFDGVELLAMEIAHTPVASTSSESGPYAVQADIVNVLGFNVTSAEVVYTVDDGLPQTVAMTNTVGTTWVGGIPGQVAPSTVNYFIRAQDSGGHVETEPYEGDFSFFVAIQRQIYFNDFEGAGDEGWTHGLTTGGQDDWERGTPMGLAGDPPMAANGLKAWGNDLSFDGRYPSSTSSFLAAPQLNCRGHSNVHLRFSRWLTVDAGPFDRAIVEVNGIQVWSNPAQVALTDSDWSTQVIDISDIADNYAEVDIRFLLVSNNGSELGGWNIDDFEVFSLGPNYGGENVLAIFGDTLGFSNRNVTYTIYHMEPSAPWALLVSLSNTGSVIMGKSFDIGSPHVQVGTGVANASGLGVKTFRLPNSLSSGTKVYVEAGSLGSAGIDESNLITLTIF